MPKRFDKESVLHDWVLYLPFMQQAMLLTALRGPDGCSKHNTAKNIIRYMRGIILKPAGYIKGNEDSFMWINLSRFKDDCEIFFSDTDIFPMHFLMHLYHAAEIIAYKHPDEDVRRAVWMFYESACKGLHLLPETEKGMDQRMEL